MMIKITKDILTRELVRNIMGNLGMIPKAEFGKYGITLDDFLLPKKIKIEYEGSDVENIPICAAQVRSENEQLLKVMCCSLKDDMILVFGIEDMQIYGLKLDYYANVMEHDWGKFLVKLGSSWVEPSTYDQLMACAGFEKLSDVGVKWRPCNDYNRLFESLMELIEL